MINYGGLQLLVQTNLDMPKTTIFLLRYLKLPWMTSITINHSHKDKYPKTQVPTTQRVRSAAVS